MKVEHSLAALKQGISKIPELVSKGIHAQEANSPQATASLRLSLSEMKQATDRQALDGCSSAQ